MNTKNNSFDMTRAIDHEGNPCSSTVFAIGFSRDRRVAIVFHPSKKLVELAEADGRSPFKAYIYTPSDESEAWSLRETWRILEFMVGQWIHKKSKPSIGKYIHANLRGKYSTSPALHVGYGAAGWDRGERFVLRLEGNEWKAYPVE